MYTTHILAFITVIRGSGHPPDKTWKSQGISHWSGKSREIVVCLWWFIQMCADTQIHTQSLWYIHICVWLWAVVICGLMLAIIISTGCMFWNGSTSNWHLSVTYGISITAMYGARVLESTRSGIRSTKSLPPAVVIYTSAARSAVPSDNHRPSLVSCCSIHRLELIACLPPVFTISLYVSTTAKDTSLTTVIPRHPHLTSLHCATVDFVMLYVVLAMLKTLIDWSLLDLC